MGSFSLEAALGPFAGTLGARGGNAAWWDSFFDPTRGFPGEGHPPKIFMAPLGLPPDDEWLARASRVLHGQEAFEGQGWIASGLSPDSIHDTLLKIALQGNSSRPIAARVQSNPARIARLLGSEDPSTRQARDGCAYNLAQRPFQIRRPRPIRLNAGGLRAAQEEIERLEHVCRAIEAAPEHDRDKALTPSAPEWELRPLPRGSWPAEKRIPQLASHEEVRAYDAACLASQQTRRLAGRPFRDFESAVFVVPKKDGRYRLCTDYRALNEFQTKVPFKMDTLQSVADCIQRNDFGMLVDLTDCYLTMGLHPSQRKYCRFRHPGTGRRMQWKTVSFGMSEAPRICTKLLRPLIGLLKRLGVRCVLYIDDLLLLHQDRTTLARGMAVAMHLLQSQVGLNLKTSKCSFRPCREFTCLGFEWNTETMTCSVPRARLWEAQRTARRLLKGGSTPVATRDLARFVGKVTAMTRGIVGARRRLLYIQQQLGVAVRQGGFTGRMVLSPDSLRALVWWTGPQPWERNGAPLAPVPRPIQGSVQSDAATETLGWGGTLTMVGKPTISTRGYFTASERSMHINALELLGCWHTISALLPLAVPQAQWADVHLSCELDSIVAIKYAMVANSRSLKMSKVGAQFFDWREQNKLQLSCRHIRGIDNTKADALSRREWNSGDWRLDTQLLRSILRQWHCTIDIDLFASRWNTQAKKFFSWEHDNKAIGVDSLSHAWDGTGTLYAYPPQALLPRILHKVINERVYDMVLVTPLFPHASWWPTLLQVGTAVPIVLPRRRWVTTDPAGNPSWSQNWPLVAWRISGQLEYARKCRRYTQRNLFEWQIRHQIRSVLGSSWATVRNETSLMMAATHDAVS